MIRRGLDSNILIYAHMPSLSESDAARAFLQHQLLDPNIKLVITPTILHEFVHVLSDGRRFEPPVAMAEVLTIASGYLGRSNIECIATNEKSAQLAFELMMQFQLGRKRLADTLFAATLITHGINELITSNEKDYALFEQINIINPLST